jgi:hypothetical protein
LLTDEQIVLGFGLTRGENSGDRLGEFGRRRRRRSVLGSELDRHLHLPKKSSKNPLSGLGLLASKKGAKHKRQAEEPRASVGLDAVQYLLRIKTLEQNEWYI